METNTLAVLEEATEPYRSVGFVITSQSQNAITLSYRPKKFSYLFFIITLLLIWPVAVVYLITHNIQKERSVCVRITSQGHVEVSGYTLEVIARERRRRIFINVLLVVVVAVTLLLLVLRGYLSRM